MPVRRLYGHDQDELPPDYGLLRSPAIRGGQRAVLPEWARQCAAVRVSTHVILFRPEFGRNWYVVGPGYSTVHLKSSRKTAIEKYSVLDRPIGIYPYLSRENTNHNRHRHRPDTDSISYVVTAIPPCQ